ncbi:MAG: glycosyltransferase family 2 protein [Vicinamibacteria bacterium]|jgi:N-acetylglucosaminyl-diphospho-decaprenol L-rhamnosyltransferase
MRTRSDTAADTLASGAPIDAIVVTHDSAEDVARLAASEPTRSSFRRIIVVDNDSSDRTRDLAADAGFEVHRQATNMGFAAAANVGARLSDTPVFALLNPDVRVADLGGVARLAAQLVDPQVGAVAPGLVLRDGSLQDSARRVPTPTDLIVRRFADRQPDAVRATTPVDVDWAVGACLLLRRSAFDRVNGFDERYFLYFEDVDLGVRLRAAGYRLRYVPTVRVFHDHGAASRSGITSPATRRHIRSALRFYAHHPTCLVRRPGGRS